MGTTMGRLPGLNIPASIIELIEGIVMICVIISYAVRYAMDVRKKKAMMVYDLWSIFSPAPL